jgi:YD repeat-containing protein
VFELAVNVAAQNLLGRQTSATDPDSGASSSTYNLTGLLTSTTDARGQTIAYAYDELGRKTAEHSGARTGTKLAAWFYDTAPNGVGLPAYNVRYTPQGNYSVGVSRYNGAGRPADNFVQVPAGETGLAGFHKTTFAYTTTGLLRTGRPVTLGGLVGEDILVDYDRYGQPKSSFGYNSYVSASYYTAGKLSPSLRKARKPHRSSAKQPQTPAALHQQDANTTSGTGQAL